MVDKESFLLKLKSEFSARVQLRHCSADAIDNDEPIFGNESRLQLDSLDALELILLIEEHFGIKIRNGPSSRAIFKSFNTVGEYLLGEVDSSRLSAFLGGLERGTECEVQGVH